MVRWRPQSSPQAALAKALAHHQVDTVLDVGANVGQYGQHLRELGFRGRIVSFEPLTVPRGRLQTLAANDPLWTVAPQMAIGEQEGNVTINVASNGGASSSILPMLARHEHAAPDVAYVGSEIVFISRLDIAARDFLVNARKVFLKVDVQGYELQVLQGATEILPSITGGQVEVSFVPLYSGQSSFLTVAEWLRAHDFDIWGVIPGFADNSTGQVLQADVVFFRTWTEVSPSNA